MPPIRPTVILTRPIEAAQRSAAALGQIEADLIVSPLLRIEPVEPLEFPESMAAVILTSQNGAAGLRPEMAGMTAFCVGARTAEMAKGHGLIPISADGTVEDLLELLIAQKPEGGLVHLRGAMARGDLAPRLRANGIEAADVICYRQVPVALNDAAKSVLDGENPVILPLYSPETARLCGQAGPFRAQISVIAMSAQVARAAEQINAGRVVRVEHPNGANMLAAITSAVATLVQLEGRSGKG